jgi:hypothetical protein
MVATSFGYLCILRNNYHERSPSKCRSWTRDESRGREEDEAAAQRYYRQEDVLPPDQALHQTNAEERPAGVPGAVLPPPSGTTPAQSRYYRRGTRSTGTSETPLDTLRTSGTRVRTTASERYPQRYYRCAAVLPLRTGQIRLKPM